MSGVAISRSTRPNRRSTCSGSVASQPKARAPVSPQSAPSFSVWRAASATRIPSRANSRASDALKPSPAPTIRAVLYFGVSIFRIPFALPQAYLGAQPGQATCFFQNVIERGPIGDGSIFGAQHAKRPGMIFLRLLYPDLVAECDAELFLSFRQRLLVGRRPRHESRADLLRQDRHQSRCQIRPALEFALRP